MTGRPTADSHAGTAGAALADSFGGALPIVVGVTGHRDLREADAPSLLSAVQQFFRELAALCPHTPIILLSALAEGADRLVARVALEAGHAVVAPLPMPLDEYERDFSGLASRQQFHELRARAWRCFEVRSPQTAGREREWSRQDVRDRAYARAGAWISQHSQIVIALWDGVETSTTGGTADIIRFELRGAASAERPAYRLLDPVESGAVYHIVTPRFSNPAPEGAPFSTRWLFPELASRRSWSKESYDRILKRMDMYNRDVKSLAGDPRVHARLAARRLLPLDTNPAVAEPGLDTLDKHYAAADCLALKFRSWTRRTLVGTLALGVTAFSMIEVFDEASPDRPLLLLLFPLLLLAGYLVLRWAGGRDHRNKYLDYRALAEGLRVQFFWRLVGMDDDAANHYLRKHSGELEWIREALRSANVLAGSASSSEEDGAPGRSLARCGLARRHWIEEQGGFFRSRQATQVAQDTRLNRLASAFFGIGIFVTIALFGLLTLAEPTPSVSSLKSLGILLLSFSLALAAAIRGYRELIAIAQQAKQYDRMATLFENAAHLLQGILAKGELAGALAVLQELGEEALLENGDWVLLHRSRDLDIRQGA